MATINALFIGGVKDGQWMAVEESRKEFYVPVRTSASLVMAMVEMKTEVYRAERLAGQEKRFTLYVLKGMTGDDVIAALINGYKKCD